MTVLAVCSVKHSPGATTLALALTSAWSNAEASDDVPVVLVEADPTGGDLGARLGLSLDPGLVALAASARHAGSGLDVLANAQPLPCGGVAVLGPVNPQQAEAALSTIGPRLCESLRGLGGGVIDCGRWAVGAHTSDVMRAAFALRGLAYDAHPFRCHHDLLHALVSEEMTKRLACPAGVNRAERRIATDQDRPVEPGRRFYPLRQLIDARIEL